MEPERIKALNDLKAKNVERIRTLQQRGVALQGLAEGYRTRLLEAIAGDQLPEIQLAHELWVADQLDNAEIAVARQSLTGGIAQQFPGWIKH